MFKGKIENKNIVTSRSSIPQGLNPEHDDYWNVMREFDNRTLYYEFLKNVRLGNNYYSCKKQVRVNVAKRVGLYLESPYRTMQRCDTARVSGLGNLA